MYREREQVSHVEFYTLFRDTRTGLPLNSTSLPYHQRQVFQTRDTIKEQEGSKVSLLHGKLQASNSYVCHMHTLHEIDMHSKMTSERRCLHVIINMNYVLFSMVYS